jgi:hypothetical protein
MPARPARAAHDIHVRAVEPPEHNRTFLPPEYEQYATQVLQNFSAAASLKISSRQLFSLV